MAKTVAALKRIENDGRIAKETDYGCWYQLELALLLALRERGILDAMQYRRAEETLRQQRTAQTKRRLRREGE